MAMLIGPKGRTPDASIFEHQWVKLDGAATYVVADGGGFLHTVEVGVVGTLAIFYDTRSGGTTDDTTEIATVSLAALTSQPIILDISFSQGLTVIVTGAAELTLTGRFAQTLNPRTFPPAGRGGALYY